MMELKEYNNQEVFLKNWVAFKAIIDSAITTNYGDVPRAGYFIEKFERYVLSRNPEEYKRGMHPSLYVACSELQD